MLKNILNKKLAQDFFLHLFAGIIMTALAYFWLTSFEGEMKCTLICSENSCSYIKSSLFGKNKSVENFNLDNNTLFERKTKTGKTRKGRTYTHTAHIVKTNDKDIHIKEKLYDALIIYDRYKIKNLDKTDYSNSFYLLAFSALLLFGGIYNFTQCFSRD